MAQSIFFVAQNLALLISAEADFLFRVKDQVQLLSNEISLLSSTLQDANEKRRSTNEVKEWLNQIRDVVMEAEDLIDFFIFAAEQRRHRNILTRYISYPNILYNLHKLGMAINNSNEKIKNLSIRRFTLGLATSEAGQSSTSMMITNEEGQSFHRGDRLEEFYVIGIEEEENEIIKKLLMHVEPLRSCPTVVSIVGMGGSGKTTLARQVYKRNDVKEHFQTYAWISVSQQYRIKDLLHVIIEQIIRPLTTEEKKELDVESLIHRLSSHLKETTYLIVFDDLWRPEDWHVLKKALPVQEEGYQSRVLITTRNETVARHADPMTNPHHKRLLNEDESWKLFLTAIMKSKGVGCPKDLEDLGRRIVHKCHGLPLAIVLLGGLLSIKSKTHIAWSKVLNSVNWELNQNEGSCKQVLALSYTDLPDHLKPCFLYLGLFPEDYEILRYKLIWLWVAEGFIQPRDRSTMEDVAEEYMEELIQRSMIQATGRSYDKRVTGCRMHDLVRDVAISEAKQERFLEILGSDYLISPKKCRRLSIMEPTGGMYGSSPITNALNQSSTPLIHPRSLLCFSKTIERNKWMNSRSSFYEAMKLVRVLDLEGVSYIPSCLLKEIGKLILLKYLSLRHTNVKELPSSIGDLQNLQTLDLCYTHLRQLPVTIVKLKQLRNLLFCNPFGGASRGFDCHVDHMTNLRTLFLHEGKWMEGRLEKLSNLRELRIGTYGRSLSPYKEALTNSITKLTHLRGLSLVESLTFQSNRDALILPISFCDHLELYNMILVGITGIRDFPPNLTTLYLGDLGSLSGQRMDQLMEALKKLPKLRCLMFTRACPGSKIFISADGFPQLEELGFIGLDGLEELMVEEGALPNLKVLKIERCGLKRLPHGLKQVVSLQELTMSSMSKELYYSVRKDVGEDWEIIQHIPSIETRYKSDLALVHGSIEFGQWC